MTGPATVASPPLLHLFRPRLRDGVQLHADDGGVECTHRDRRCRVDDGGDGDARRLVELLREGGHTCEELVATCPGVRGRLADVLAALDAAGMLTETPVPGAGGAVTGRQLYAELRRMADRVHDRVKTGRFHDAMVEGTATRGQLVGYALEYYHLVRSVPRLVAPALAREEPGEVAELLQSFLVGGLHHDRMLAASLAAVGVGKDELEAMQPLPSTFALCAALGAAATNDPLTFKAMLHLFRRGSPGFGDAFATASRAVGLPEAFVKPVVARARLLADGHDADISAELLARVPAVGPEEQRTVRKHVAIVVETLAVQEDEILDHYGAPGAVIPRVFS